MDEFSFIESWLRRFAPPGEQVLVPAGDDAAVFCPTPGVAIVATTDALVDGVHFHADRWPAAAVGHKAVAVNLSDLAAMGARPRFALLALALPPPEEFASRVSNGKARLPGRRSPSLYQWLKKAATGMSRACEAAGVELVGGNVSRARDLAFTMTLLGEASDSRVLCRAGAQRGDSIWVSGTVGDSALGLRSMLKRRSAPSRLNCLERRHCLPEARVDLGLELCRRRAASSAIDVSDGLLADLGHILAASQVGATIELSALPLSSAYRRETKGEEAPYSFALRGGEDYELLFTAPKDAEPAVREASLETKVSVSKIGTVTNTKGVRLMSSHGRAIESAIGGWRHL